MADELAPEVVATASSRVAAALAKDNPPAPAVPQQTTLSGISPAGEPATQAGEKRTRTTVAKLLQKYQERADALAGEIFEAEEGIEAAKYQLQEMRFKHQFWLDAIAEINAD